MPLFSFLHGRKLSCDIDLRMRETMVDLPVLREPDTLARVDFTRAGLPETAR
jgi:hypothetical protein